MNFLNQSIEKKEGLKFNVQFTFFKVFMVFTELETASASWIFLTQIPKFEGVFKPQVQVV